MSTFFIILIVLISIILITNSIYFLHTIGIFPFPNELKRPRESFYPSSTIQPYEKAATHGFQVLNGWNDIIRKSTREDIYQINKPAETLKKTITQYQEDPSQENFDILMHLSNHISNRVRYDDEINSLIEKISEMLNNKGKNA
jgi:hypothetical protein